GVALIAMASLSIGGVYRLTREVPHLATVQVPDASSFYAPGIVIDLQAPVRPVVEATFTYNGPGGPFVQKLRGVFDAEGTCNAYISGASGRLQTPYALYLKNTKLQRSPAGRVTIAAYKGPGVYTGAQLEGEMGAI